jgi:hypothetical protein
MSRNYLKVLGAWGSLAVYLGIGAVALARKLREPEPAPRDHGAYLVNGDGVSADLIPVPQDWKVDYIMGMIT